MRWLINYIRSCFCRHDWESLGEHSYYRDDASAMPVRRVDVFRCRKCGYVQKVRT